MIPNASNTAPALAALDAGGRRRSRRRRRGARHRAAGAAGRAGPGGPPPPGRCWRRRRRRWPTSVWRPRRCPGGASGLVGGTGYTGEDGVELFVPVEAAVDVWRALVAAGVDAGRARRPGHAPPGDGLSVARPRARARDHAAAGRPRLGRRLGQAGASSAGMRWSPRRSGARPGGWPGSCWRIARCPGPSAPCGSTAKPSARSRAATCRPSSSGASPWPSCRPGTSPGTPVEVDIRGRAARRRGREACPSSNRRSEPWPLVAWVSFVPHTDAEIEAMLGFLGLDSLDDLFAHIPDAVRLAGGLAMEPGRSEADVLDRLARWPAATGRPARRREPGSWCASPAAAPTSTTSPPRCGRWPAAASSSPPTRRTSRSWPRACSRPCSSTRRCCAASPGWTSPTPPSTTPPRPPSRG